MTDAPHTDDPDASEDGFCWCLQCYWQLCCINRLQQPQYLLKKRNKYFKNVHNTKKNIKNITDAPDGDANIYADGVAADLPNTADDDTGSIDSKTSL